MGNGARSEQVRSILFLLCVVGFLCFAISMALASDEPAVSRSKVESTKPGKTPRGSVSPREDRVFRWKYDGPPFVLTERRRRNFVARLVRDFSVQLQEPFQFAKRRPLWFSLGIAGMGGLIAADEYTLPWLAPTPEFRESSGYKIASAFSRYGEALYALPLIAGFGIYGYAAHQERERETFLMCTEALITSGTWTTVVKFLAGRERPRQRDDRGSDWTGPYGIWGERGSRGTFKLQSFPSGHSSAIFALATILAHQYPKYHVVPIISYSIAVGVAYSRMVVEAHWPSDVLVGSVLGCFCARQVIRDNSHRPRKPVALGLIHPHPARPKVRVTGISPVIGPHGRGVTVRLEF